MAAAPDPASDPAPGPALDASRDRILEPGLDLLLGSPEAAIRHAALTELLDRTAVDTEVREARDAIPTGRIVRALLEDRPDMHPYRKWQGAHWRLVSLMDLSVPRDVAPAAVLDEPYERVLDWLVSPGHLRGVAVIAGRARRCASQEGNALAVGSWLGRAADPRVERLARNLVAWQWPDGGWNCDARPQTVHSSFNESLPPLLGLARYAEAAGDEEARAAAGRTAEFLLRHRVVESERTGNLAHPSFGKLHYPPYWHYDLLAALRGLAASGHLGDPRAGEAIDLLQSSRRRDGTWQAGSRWWRAPGSAGSNVDVVDWGGRRRSEPLTLNALRVLKASGRWSPP